MAVAVVLSAIVTTLMTKERFTHANRKHVPLLPAIRATLKNRPFTYLLLLKICEIFGGRLTGGISFYLGMYYVCQGDQDLATR
jgi:GPH family glycoside/pentoside/hexuronide:cation symporter